MTAVATSAPFVDTTADHLTYTLDAGELPALAVKQVGHLELRVLGASHQIRVTDTTGEWFETLACQPGQEPHLPAEHHRPGYTFQSETGTYPPNQFTLEARSIRAHVTKENGLQVTFQGNPDALTAITARTTGTTATWRTWHLYPQTGQIVTTLSRLTTPRIQE